MAGFGGGGGGGSTITKPRGKASDFVKGFYYGSQDVLLGSADSMLRRLSLRYPDTRLARLVDRRTDAMGRKWDELYLTERGTSGLNSGIAATLVGTGAVLGFALFYGGAEAVIHLLRR